MLNKRTFKTKDDVEITFEIRRPEAETAELMLEANGWEPVPMRRARKSDPFRTRMRLPKDKSYQFRYRFDGEVWDNDDAADAYWPNEMGSDNSVVSTAV